MIWRRVRSGRVLWLAAPLAAVIGVAVWLYTDSATSQAVKPAQAAPSALPPPAVGQAFRNPDQDSTRRSKVEVLQAQLREVQHRLDSYRAATRYPHESRPIAENPDQIRPFDPVSEDKPLRSGSGEPVSGLRVRTSQERVFVSGQESVLFTVGLYDEQNRPQELRVSRAVAYVVQSSPDANPPPPVAVQFEDKGTQGDVLAGDRVLSTRFQPSTQGFANTTGTIRVQLTLNADTGPSQTFFDIVYSPQVPATWAGSVRDTVDNGSLAFLLKAQVKEAGRYVVTARAYDAAGKPFALLTFNDEIPAGTQEIKLPVFGKLIRDAKPAFPITLRDVEGFRLYEDRFPDRAMMPRWGGVAHTSQMYAAGVFSDAEWSSEERQRYLNEFGKDVQVAQDALRAAMQGAPGVAPLN